MSLNGIGSNGQYYQYRNIQQKLVKNEAACNREEAVRKYKPANPRIGGFRPSSI